MTINYEKLWNMLDAQGISKDQLRKASGLTTYVFDKIEKNGSVQFDALIKVCGVLNCAIGDIVDVEYDYEKKRAIPNVDFTDVDAFSAGGQFEQDWLSNYTTKPKGPLDIPIDEIDLSVRTFNCLRRAGVDTVGDLMSFSNRNDLLSVRNLGHKCLDDIEKKLLSIGLTAPWMINTDTHQAETTAAVYEGLPIEKPIICNTTNRNAHQLGTVIDELDLSVRAFNCLKRFNLDSVTALIAHSEADLMNVPGMNNVILDEVKRKLKEIGLSLKEENDTL